MATGMPRDPRPRDLREALGMAFVHRTRARWRAGTSTFLGLEYESQDGGIVVDVRHLAEFREIRSAGGTLSIGAFADVEQLTRDPLVARSLGGGPLAAAGVRFRLGALGAHVTIAGPGATRSAPFADVVDRRRVAPQEVPVRVDVQRTGEPAVGFGERRISRRDGVATFDLHVFAALALTGFHRIRSSTVAYAVDGSPPLTIGASGALLDGAIVAKTTFHDAARHAADAFRGDDERTSVLRRTIVPLVLSALNDAYAHARATGD